MTDSIDNAVTQSKNRGLFVGAGIKYLGKDRRLDAEALADLMLAQIERISVSAYVEFPAGSKYPDELVKAIGDELHRRGEAVAQVAIRALSEVFRETLAAASRALHNEPPAASN